MVTLAFLLEKLSQPRLYKDLSRKTAFFGKWSWFKFNNLGLALGNFEILQQCSKRVKSERQKVLGLISTFVLGCRGKAGRGTSPPSFFYSSQAQFTPAQQNSANLMRETRSYSGRNITHYPVDTGRKLNVHKTFRRRPGRLLNVLCTFNLCPVSTG